MKFVPRPSSRPAKPPCSRPTPTKHRIAALLLSSVASLASWAQSETSSQPSISTQTKVTQPEQPLELLELLEFLGEWQTEDGEWIDPESLQANTASAAPGETNE